MRLYRAGATYYLKVHQNDPDLPFLVLMHGFMGSGEVFEPLISDLSTFSNPVTIDLCGHGKTVTPTNPSRFETAEQVKDLKSILDRLQFSDLFLYGYSMGGRLALQYTVNYPGNLKGLILESTHCGISDSAERKKRRETDQKRAEEIRINFPDFLDEWMKMPLFRSSDNEMYESVMQKQNPELMAASLLGFGAGEMPSICDKLEQITTKSLLIAGSEDQKYVEKMSEMAHLMDHAKLEIVQSAGHRVHSDKPGKFVKIINQFISEDYG